MSSHSGNASRESSPLSSLNIQTSSEIDADSDVLQSSENSLMEIASVPSSPRLNEIIVDDEEVQLEADVQSSSEIERDAAEMASSQNSPMEIASVSSLSLIEGVGSNTPLSSSSESLLSTVSSSSSSSLSSSSLSELSYNNDNDAEENQVGWFDQPIYTGAIVNGGDALYQILKVYITNRLSKKALSDVLDTIHLLLPNDHTIPRSKYKLLSLIDKVFPNTQSDFSTKHRICSKCFYYLGKWSDEPIERCTRCGSTKLDSFFLELNLESELRNAFEVRDLHILIDGFRNECAEENTENLCDLTSGTEFRRLKRTAIPGEYDLFLLWFTDGVQVSKSGKSHMWPIYTQVVNISPKFRRSFQFVCGIFYTNRSSKKPDMNSFLKPFTSTLENLYENGFQWKNRILNRTVTTKVIAPIACLDAPAKSGCQNVMQYNGECSCPSCEEKGESCETGSGSNWIFPIVHENTPLRTAERMEKQTRIVEKYKNLKHFKGVKGDSIVTRIPHFDRVKGFVPDYMHAVLLGVMDMLLKLWCSTSSHDQDYYLSKENRDEIDNILGSITPPDDVTRTPRKLCDLSVWKASELREFLLYYAPIVLKNRLNVVHYDHFLLLSRSIYILLKDEIKLTELNLADTFLHIFVNDVESLYGRNKCSFNIHQLKHLVPYVRLWGPLWAWSAFPSEDHNGELIKMTHGTKNVDLELSNTIKIIQSYQCVKYLMNPIRQNEQVGNRTLGPSTRCDVEESDLRAITHATQLNDRQLQEAKILIFRRCVINNDIYTSELYNRQKKRANFYVEWKESDKILFGAIKYFFTIEGNLYALLRQLIISNDKSQEIKNREIGFNFNQSLIHVRDSYCIHAVPVERIMAKRLRVQDYICIFPNNVEKK